MKILGVQLNALLGAVVWSGFNVNSPLAKRRA